LLQNQYTYKYIAQAPTGNPDVYGADNYGANAYSCAQTDQVCLAGGPSAPNTGLMSSSNPVFMGGIFITAVLVVAVVAYAIFAKVKRTKAGK
jgi:hypothetical protein